MTATKSKPCELEKDVMPAEEARELCESIRDSIGKTGAKLLELYERKGWLSLGYGSWRECVVKEFKQSKTHLYRLLTAAQVAREISPNGENPVPESQCRELAKLPPSERAPAFSEATEAANGHPTAADVRKVVRERKSKASGETPAEATLTPEQSAEKEKLMRDHIFRTDLASIEDEINLILQKFADHQDALIKFLAAQLRKARDFKATS